MSRRLGLADAYARYAELVTAQIAAVDAGDLDGFTALTRERDRLARDIDEMHADDPDGSADLAKQAIPALESALDADVRLREKLAAIQSSSLDEARSIDRNRTAIRSYAAPSEMGAKVDLSL